MGYIEETQAIERGESAQEQAFATWDVPWHARIPAYLFGLPMIAAFLVTLVQAGPGGMHDWGISGAALAQGRWHGIASHMFAHGGIMHIVMNMSALFALGGPLVSRLGDPPASWLRFALLFVASGLAGAALYLAVHPRRAPRRRPHATLGKRAIALH